MKPISTLLATAGLAFAVGAQASVNYTFDTDAQGFALTGGGLLSHDAGGFLA